MKQAKPNFNILRDHWREMVADDPKISAGAFRVAFVVTAYMREDSQAAFPKQETLAVRVGVSCRAVRGYLAELTSAGYLTVAEARGRGRLNRYTMDLSKLPSAQKNRNGPSALNAENRNERSAFDEAVPEAAFRFSDEKTGSTASENRKNRVDKTGTGVPPESPKGIPHESLAADAAWQSEGKAAAEPIDVRARLFGHGLDILVRISGRQPNQCRTIIGRWLKDTRDDAKRVLRAIEDARDERAADPVPWIAATLKGRNRPSNSHEFIWGRH